MTGEFIGNMLDLCHWISIRTVTASQGKATCPECDKSTALSSLRGGEGSCFSMSEIKHESKCVYRVADSVKQDLMRMDFKERGENGC